MAASNLGNLGRFCSRNSHYTVLSFIRSCRPVSSRTLVSLPLQQQERHRGQSRKYSEGRSSDSRPTTRSEASNDVSGNDEHKPAEAMVSSDDAGQGTESEHASTIENGETQQKESPADSTSSLPWYLQVDPAIQPQTNPFAARQRIPDLPTSPPSLLAPLLQHASLDLGMEDLSLLDLRTLDPPSALGSNLIMLIGTLRSEKHLHVSADRMCRWLRTEYKLTPFADGLLGRNELKLRLKRKARRSKLLSSVGAKTTGSGSVDDGIRTGWICVNVGEVGGGSLQGDVQAELDEQGIVGFAEDVRGCRIVVQMMTDERRGQLDLESLWTGILRRSSKATEGADGSMKPFAHTEKDNPFPEAQLVGA